MGTSSPVRWCGPTWAHIQPGTAPAASPYPRAWAGSTGLHCRKPDEERLAFTDSVADVSERNAPAVRVESVTTMGPSQGKPKGFNHPTGRHTASQTEENVALSGTRRSHRLDPGWPDRRKYVYPPRPRGGTVYERRVAPSYGGGRRGETGGGRFRRPMMPGRHSGLIVVIVVILRSNGT